jgi:hypothetical protein
MPQVLCWRDEARLGLARELVSTSPTSEIGSPLVLPIDDADSRLAVTNRGSLAWRSGSRFYLIETDDLGVLNPSNLIHETFTPYGNVALISTVSPGKTVT